VAAAVVSPASSTTLSACCSTSVITFPAAIVASAMAKAIVGSRSWCSPLPSGDIGDRDVAGSGVLPEA
jgi:hypothetical protein